MILKKVHYTLSNKDLDLKKDYINVFPSNGEKELTDTVKLWANKYLSKDRELTTFTVDNLSIKELKILSIAKRMEGGRAYKILIKLDCYDKPFMVDMREDTMMDIINLYGIQPGGNVTGSFIWVQNSSQYKLISTDSEVYKKHLEDINND